MNDFTNYMRCDPYFRKNNYGGLTFSMLYAYSENFVLVFPMRGGSRKRLHDGENARRNSGKESRKSARCVRLYDVPSGQEAALYGTGLWPD